MTLPVADSVALDMYRRMRLIRTFEDLAAKLANASELPGTTHEYSGEEAIAVGVCFALDNHDVITSTHRGHGHVLAKGSSADRVLAELMGREGGYNRGRGGSLHVADFSLGVLGANGIVGAGTPMACGAALAFKKARSRRVAVSFFGEGGINQGVVLESMNMAAAWALPVLFIVENNGYAISTPTAAVTAGEIWKRGVGFDIRSQAVDGMDVFAVYEAACQAVDIARDGGGPSLLECRAYRYSHHFSAEGMLNLHYRTEDEVSEWRARDPIERLATQLTADGIWSDRAGCDAAVDAELAKALAFARNSPLPDSSTAYEYAYAVEYPGMPARGIEQ